MAKDRYQQEPRQVLSAFSAICMMVGMVVGIGIFRTPAIVAGNVSGETMFLLAWVAGGAVTLIGALCYSELASAHPHAGGEYHFLSRAFGKPVAMMFGWARCSVIQTGSIAAVAFVLGDYMARLWPLGEHASAIYAAIGVSVFTGINMMGTRPGKNVQVVATLLVVAAIITLIVLGLTTQPSDASVATAPASAPDGRGAFGMAMIFVLLTYGGWNEAAYLTGELENPRRNIPKVLALGTVVLVVLYLAVNFAFLRVLGLEVIRDSQTVAADMMRVVSGPAGERMVSIAILLAALSTLNATIFTGARVFYVMARDMTVMRWVGIWDERGTTPVNGYLLQGAVALVLIGLGAVTRDGFQSMVDYTAPVFWSFMLLVAVSLFILRRREPATDRPFRVPLYPLTPLLFCLTCVGMLYSSIAYTGWAGLIGLAVLLAGTPLLLFRRKDDLPAPDSQAGPAASSPVKGDVP